MKTFKEVLAEEAVHAGISSAAKVIHSHVGSLAHGSPDVHKDFGSLEHKHMGGDAHKAAHEALTSDGWRKRGDAVHTTSMSGAVYHRGSHKVKVISGHDHKSGIVTHHISKG